MLALPASAADHGGGHGAAPAADSHAAPADDRAKRKLERLISLLVEKGVITPGEIDGVDQAAAAAEGAAKG